MASASEKARAARRAAAREAESAKRKPVSSTREKSSRDRILANAGIWLTILSTIALLPGAMDRWILPKVALAVIGCLVSSFASRTGRLPRHIWILVAVGAIVLLLCALLGAEPFAQLVGRWPRYEGLVTLPAYFAAFWTGARALGPHANAARYETTYLAVATISIAIGFISILEGFGLRPIASNLARPGSLLGNASDQGIVGVICFAVLLVPTLGRLDTATPRTLVQRWFPALGAAFAVVSIALSASRTALFALLIVCLLAAVVLLTHLRRISRARLKAALVAAAAVVGVGLGVAVPLARNRLVGSTSLLTQFTQDRGALWVETLRLVGAHPLVGVGPSGFIDALPAYTTSTWFRTTGVGVTTDSPHDLFLQAAVAGGIPLVLIAVALAVVIFVTGMRALRTDALNDARREFVLGSLLALVGFGITLLAAFTAPGTTILAAFLAGAVVAAAPRPAEALAAAGRRVPDTVTSIVVAIWAVLIILTTSAEIPMQSGTTAAAQGDITGSLADFAAAHSLRPWDSDITLIEAQALTAAASAKVPGAKAPALTWSRAAYATFPHSVLAAKSLAASQQFDGQLAAATTTAANLNSRAPNDPETLARLGLVYAQQGQLTNARPVLEKAVRLNPKDAASWQALGFVYQKLGNTAGVARVTAVLAKLSAKG